MDSKTFLDNFEIIANAPGGIARLRILILDLAVRGKLIALDQDPKCVDTWIELGSVMTLEYGKPLDRSLRSANGSIPVYGANGVKAMTGVPLVENRGIVVGRKGSAGEVNITEGPFWPLDVTFYTKFEEDVFDLQYLYYLLKSLDLPKMARGIKPGINRNDVNKIRVLFISLAVQRQIVAKVDELMALCDELEAAQNRRNLIRTAARLSTIDSISTATTPEDLTAAWTRINQNWTTLTDRAENISSLRSLILDLAVRGCLVEKDVLGLSASEVTKSMRQKRRADIQLLKRGDRTKNAPQKSQPQLFPSHWEKGLLGELCLIVMGNSPPGDSYSEVERGVPLINGPVEFSPSPLGVTQRTKFTTKPTYMCEQGDILVCVRGATTGRTNIAGFEACIGRGVALVRGYESQKFINLFMWNIGSVLLAAGKGTTFPSVSYDDLANLEIAIPPLNEQKGLVAKVESLMDMCDEFERSLNKREELMKKIASALTAEVAA
jgi:type I restriction enzyme S subunit